MSKEAQPTQQFVEIEEIRDGVIVLRNGSVRRILMVSGINFELKSEEEQNVITAAYQSFLNTLDFSVQIVVHSRKLNIDNYLNKLAQRQTLEENELLKSQMSEYIEFIRSYLETNAVMVKNFFVVVSYESINIPSGGKGLFGMLGFGSKNKKTAAEENSEQKLIQLNQRTEQVVNGLAQIGLRVVALNDEELVELFYNLYNPGTTEKKQ